MHVMHSLVVVEQSKLVLGIAHEGVSAPRMVHIVGYGTDQQASYLHRLQHFLGWVGWGRGGRGGGERDGGKEGRGL